MKKIIFPILAIIIFLCISSCKNNVKNPLRGKWTSLARSNLQLTLTFEDNNTYITDVRADNMHILINGKYHINKETLFIRDTLNTPVPQCDYSIQENIFIPSKAILLFSKRSMIIAKDENFALK